MEDVPPVSEKGEEIAEEAAPGYVEDSVAGEASPLSGGCSVQLSALGKASGKATGLDALASSSIDLTKPWRHRGIFSWLRMQSACDDPPADMLKASNEFVAAAAVALDPTFPTIPVRYVAEGGSQDYASMVDGTVLEMAGLELPHWSHGVLCLLDPLQPSEGRSFEMNDTGEVLR